MTYLYDAWHSYHIREQNCWEKGSACQNLLQKTSGVFLFKSISHAILCFGLCHSQKYTTKTQFQNVKLNEGQNLSIPQRLQTVILHLRKLQLSASSVQWNFRKHRTAHMTHWSSIKPKLHYHGFMNFCTSVFCEVEKVLYVRLPRITYFTNNFLKINLALS